ncbi:DedA family protein [Endozoicomonas arenosclerae]|uniref:DedA family protein n=1 Tax=Endozoicomonas arenosclerae TaxID=1633495 RepID=UPI0007863943|nr:VTT domain-containing protein [Endozoicomonas arenosclerae]
MFEYWLNYIQHPWLLALLILLGSYVLEDAAIVFAALLSADGMISGQLAFFALFVGIFTGDLGLYGLGVLSRRINKLSRLLDLASVERAGVWLENRMLTTIISVRVIPGLRFPVYTACGFFELSFLKFLILVLFASVVWTALLFSGFYTAGVMFWSEVGLWKWLLLPLIVCLIMYGHRLIYRNYGVLK